MLKIQNFSSDQTTDYTTNQTGSSNLDYRDYLLSKSPDTYKQAVNSMWKLDVPKLWKKSTPKPGSNGKLNFGQKVNNAIGSKGVQMGLQFANSALTAFDGFSRDKDINSVDGSLRGVRTNIADSLSYLGPYGTLAGTLIKGIGFAGGFSDASSGLGTGTDIANGIASVLLPGSGWLAQKTNQLERNQRVAASSGYGNVNDDVTGAMKNVGKILFGANKANSKISKAAYEQEMALSNLEKADTDIASSANPLISNRTQLQMK